MNIVVLDGHTLNPGDLSWNVLASLGNLELHERTSPSDVLARSADADILVTNKVVLSREIMDQLPTLKYIGVTATGYNVVDIEAARDHNIPVTNVPVYGTDSVAQMVFAHILNFTQHVGHHSSTVRDEKWTRCDDFCYWDFPLLELSGQTIGIVGFGRIGRATARIAAAFDMRILAYNISANAKQDGVTFVDTDRLFSESDVVSLHCPLTPESEKLVDSRTLALMKPSAFLINTSRGPLVDEQALADALNSEQIAGAGLDVLAVEPPPPDNPLLTAKNCFITPHIAWATRSARQRLMDTTVENIQAFLGDSPTNVVNNV